jgi:L-fuculose-phosphate aldolase
MNVETQLAKAVIHTALAMNRLGINRGTSGNVSVRLPHDSTAVRLLITPTATAYEDLREPDVVRLVDGVPLAGRPSSEWRFHHDLYRARPDLQAIVHTHSPYATALACRREGIPPFHYMVAMAGGSDIVCATYATYGTPELSEAVVAAMTDRKACLLANHGVVAAGATLAAALSLAEEVESLAMMYLLLLSESAMQEVLVKFRDYKPST